MRGGKNFIDLTGQKFGRLFVLKRAADYRYKDNRFRVKWVCLCECGTEKEIIGEALTRGQTKSCGCLKNKILSDRTWKGHEEISGVYWNRLKTDAAKRKIIWSITPEYVWNLFLQQNKKCALTSVPIAFERNFKKHGAKNQTASLDRKDSKVGYVEGNVQWVHKTINIIKWDWEIEELYEWCELLLKNKPKNKSTFI